KFFLLGISLYAWVTYKVSTCPEGMECDHIDRNRSNNRLENLRWTTQEYNRCRKRVRTIKSDAE
ncbi:MAG: HNH endonuclease signature motif containing protein, partial [bacterium]